MSLPTLLLRFIRVICSNATSFAVLIGFNMKMVKNILRFFRKTILDLQFLLLNYCVTYIPCWTIRKTLFRLNGLRIGKGSRILMGTKIQSPRGITIGNNSYINNSCHLDGRGGLIIGNNVNISNYSVIITASHDMHSAAFAYREGGVILDDYVWLGSRAIVLDRSHMHEASVLSAGSVLKGEAEAGKVYAGHPAKLVKDRKLEGPYDVVWQPFFR